MITLRLCKDCRWAALERRPPSLGTGQLVGLEREQLLNLDLRRRIGKPIPPQIPVLLTAHRTPPGARYTGLNRQPRESCKINQPKDLHGTGNDSPLKLNGFATVTFCTTVTRTPDHRLFAVSYFKQHKL